MNCRNKCFPLCGRTADRPPEHGTIRNAGVLRVLSLLLCLTLFAGLLTPGVLAAENISRTYYRAVDTSGDMSDAEQDSLDAECIALAETYHIDAALLAVRTSDYKGMTLAELAEGYYLDTEYGWGEDRDGVMFVYDTDTNGVHAAAFGTAKTVFGEKGLAAVENDTVGYRDEYGVWGVLYAAYYNIRQWLENSGLPYYHPGDAVNVRLGPGKDRPAWFPVDPEGFVFYQNPNEPRVVDEAEIFSAEDKAEMLSVIRDIRENYGVDAAVCTTPTSYGLGEETYVQDFFDFNGYGLGEESDGICLCIVMDPDDRAFAATATGSFMRGLYTYSAANDLDDRLIEYMRDRTDENGDTVPGDYGAGVIDWLKNVRFLIARNAGRIPLSELPEGVNRRVGKGAKLPEWYPVDPQGFFFYQDDDAPRVVDEADIFTGAEESEMRKRIADVREKYGVDVVICTTPTSYGLGEETYVQDFFDFNGYGAGPDSEGICLCLVMDPNDRAFATTSYGPSTRALHTYYNANALDDALYEAVRDKTDQNGNVIAPGDYGKGALEWIGHVETMLSKGYADAPEWFPAIGEEFERFHSADAPRVLDLTGTLTEAEAADFETRRKALSEKLGTDLVMCFVDDYLWMSGSEYAEQLWLYSGYGRGEDYSGALLVSRIDYGGEMFQFGSGIPKLSKRALGRINYQVDMKSAFSGANETGDRWLERLETFTRTGRVTHSTGRWVAIILLCTVIGMSAGVFVCYWTEESMQKPAKKVSASDYLVSGSLNISSVSDTYTGSRYSRVYSPVERSSGGSSGGSSSSGSHYSSSSHGSSSRSHTTSSRKF